MEYCIRLIFLQSQCKDGFQLVKKNTIKYIIKEYIKSCVHIKSLGRLRPGLRSY